MTRNSAQSCLSLSWKNVEEDQINALPPFFKIKTKFMTILNRDKSRR